MTASGMVIGQASFEPVYGQLGRILRDQIQAGELKAGQALPSEASLSQRFGWGSQRPPSQACSGGKPGS